MKFVIDTHLHIYPFHCAGRALESLFSNLSNASPGSIAVGCLTERFDCHIFQELGSTPPADVTDKYTLRSSDRCHQFTEKGAGAVGYLLPGQQIITSENLEVLSLNCQNRIKEGLSASETIDQILQSNGIPVVAFGFGKWLGKRGKLVNQLLAQYDTTELALGDTTMRPYGWCTTKQFRLAKSKGMKILCGSDPLPFIGEEVRPGSYASEVQSDTDDPVEALHQILQESVSAKPVGRRNSPFLAARRMQNHRNTGTIGGC